MCLRWSSRFFAALLLLLICVGGRCKPNPARPSSLTHGETETAWYAEFVAALGDEEQRFYGAILYTRQTPQGLTMDDGKAAAEVFKLVPQHDGMVLAILYNPEEQTDPPPMQLQLLVKKQKNGVVWGEPGDPVVLCDLALSQAQQILDDGGVPESLQIAMVDAARAANWVPKLPAPNQFGRFLRVPSDGHFDDEQRDAEETPEGEEEMPE